jgi:murein DD-endopeptidase MepM/ murein hydrolase activator NlpD
MSIKAWFMLGVSSFLIVSCDKENAGAPVPNIPVHTYGASSGNGSLGTHTVRTGETVWMISEKYNLALRDVLDRNQLSPPYALFNGQRLNLPAPQTYKVRENDSLYTISRLFNTSTTELSSLNKLKAPYKLTAGQTLRLPVRYSAPSPTKVTQVAMNVPPRPATVQRDVIEREELAAPQMQTQSQEPPQAQKGGYVPPPSSPDDYKDDGGAPAEKAEPVAASAVAKALPKAPAREGKFIKPVGGKVISGYGPKADGLHNDGINIQAARGDAVRAAESGVIVYTGSQIAGYGNLVLIRHRDEYVTAYAHLDKMLVKKGDVVKRGQTIGTVGSTGSVDKPQLHFEVRKGTKALNPSGLVAL